MTVSRRQVLVGAGAMAVTAAAGGLPEAAAVGPEEQMVTITTREWSGRYYFVGSPEMLERMRKVFGDSIDYIEQKEIPYGGR